MGADAVVDPARRQRRAAPAGQLRLGRASAWSTPATAPTSTPPRRCSTRSRCGATSAAQRRHARRPPGRDRRRRAALPGRPLQRAAAAHARRRGHARRAADAAAGGRRQLAGARRRTTSTRVLPKADAVMMLRVQRERMNGGVLPDRAGVQPPLRPRRPPDGDPAGPHDRDAPRPDGPRHGDHRRRRRLRPLGDRRAGHQRRRRPDGRALPAARRQRARSSARSDGGATHDQLPDQGRRDPRRRAHRPAARRTAWSPSSAATGTSADAEVVDADRAGRAARPGRPAHPPARARPRGRRDRRDRHPGRGAWAASPPCTRWPTPTRSPTPPASSSRSGGSAARPATATSTRSARSPSGWPGERLAELGAMADSAARVRVFSDDGNCVDRRGADAPGAGVRQGVRRRRRPARPGAAADRGRPDERGRALRPARAGAAGRRSPRRRSSPATACSPRTSARGCTSATCRRPARSRSSG